MPQAFRPRRVRARDARRRHRRRQRRDTGTTAARRSPGSRPAPISATTRRSASRPKQASAWTGTQPELVAAIEAAVADGMDVINLSIGEPEVEPRATSSRSRSTPPPEAGVVPVVAAGNDFDEFGRGSLSSPGTSGPAITVAAVTSPDGAGRSSLADFSASGPTPLSLRLKPDISAPASPSSPPSPEALGDDVGHVDGEPADRRRRSAPPRTAPGVVGGAAQGRTDRIRKPRRGRRPGRRAHPRRRRARGAARADIPLVLASPASVSFGLVQPGRRRPTRSTLRTQAAVR